LNSNRYGDDRRAEESLMLRFADYLRVNLYREPIDFRCGIDTLAALVDDSMQMDPLARAV
jgi:transposase